MKSISRNLSIAAALSCAAVFLAPLTVSSNELTDFFNSATLLWVFNPFH